MLVSFVLFFFCNLSRSLVVIQGLCVTPSQSVIFFRNFSKRVFLFFCLFSKCLRNSIVSHSDHSPDGTIDRMVRNMHQSNV